MAGSRQSWDDWLSSIGPPPLNSGENTIESGPEESSCASCGQVVGISAEGRVICGLLVHYGCTAACTTCGRVPATTDSEEQFEMFESKLYCREHDVKACAGCGTAVIPGHAQTLALFGRFWHGDCALCWNCDRLLALDPDVKIFDADGQLLCEPCSRILLRPGKRLFPTPSSEEQPSE